MCEISSDSGSDSLLSDTLCFLEGDVLTMDDYKCLEHETKLNDALVQFFIRFYWHQLTEELKEKVFSFLSFFFSNLTSGGYNTVRKWTKNVDLFSQQLVVVPVNMDDHWLLALVINLDSIEAPKHGVRPGILILDSIGGTNVNVVKTVRQYLKYEWETKNVGRKCPDFSERTLKSSVVKVPQQTNAYNCGQFLINYTQKIFESVPVFIKSPSRLSIPFQETKMKHAELAYLIRRFTAVQQPGLVKQWPKLFFTAPPQ